MMTKNKRGQVMLESGITLATQLLLGHFVLIGCFWVFATGFINLDAYGVARASLYGASRRCAPSRHWPKLQYLQLHYECPTPGNVLAELSLTKKYRYHTNISLR